MKLSRIQVGPQRAGDIMESRLPQSGPIEQALHQHDLMALTHLLPAVESALAAAQKPMRMSAADTASVKTGIEWKDDAAGKHIQALPCYDAGLLQIAEWIAQTHQPGAQASARCITDAHLFDYLRLLDAALCQIGRCFRVAMQLNLVETDHIARQRV